MKVNYVDILLWTAKKLKEQYPTYNLYVDSNEQKITKPSFFLEVVPMETKEGMDFWKYKIVNLLIEYVNPEAMSQEKLQMADDLSDMIGKKITVACSNGQQRNIPVFDKKPTIKDAVIMLVTLEFHDGTPEPLTETPDRAYDDLMEILALNK